MLKVLDLFSGIGGFTLGLDSTGGFKTIAFVEKDKFCQKVLKKNFPNITIEGEMRCQRDNKRDVKGDRYKADVITGGCLINIQEGMVLRQVKTIATILRER